MQIVLTHYMVLTLYKIISNQKHFIPHVQRPVPKQLEVLRLILNITLDDHVGNVFVVFTEFPSQKKLTK